MPYPHPLLLKALDRRGSAACGTSRLGAELGRGRRVKELIGLYFPNFLGSVPV